MNRRLRPHSLYDVLAALAFFGVLAGGTAYAANTVLSSDIVDGQVKMQDLAANAVTSGKLSDGQVKNIDLGPNAAASNTISDEGVKTVDIADGQVTGLDVGNESLDEEDIEDIVSSGGVTQVAVGEEKTLLEDGPFTVTAACFASDGDPDLFSHLEITSSEEHSLAEVFGGGGEMPQGISAPNSPHNFVGENFFAAAPSGATLEGYLGAGVDVLGYDGCTAVVTAVGTSALDPP